MRFCFNALQKVKVDDRNDKGESARALAMLYGYTKIVSLIDSRSPRIKAGISLFKDFTTFFLLIKHSFMFSCFCGICLVRTL